MKNKIVFLALILLILPAIASAYTVVANNPFGVSEITDFFQGLMAHMQGIIAFLAVLFVVIGGVLYIIGTGNPQLVTAAKICWSSALIGIALAAAGPTFLKEIKAIALKDGTMPTDLDQALTVKEIVMNTLRFLLSVLGILSIIGLVVSGVLYIVSFSNPTLKEQAKKGVLYCIVGITVAGSAVILIRQIAELITK